MSCATRGTKCDTTERNAKALAMNQVDRNDVDIFLSNDFMRCQLQECLQECIAGSFVGLENDKDDTDNYIVEEPISAGDGSDHANCGSHEDLNRSCAESLESNNNEEYLVATG